MDEASVDKPVAAVLYETLIHKLLRAGIVTSQVLAGSK
jgi:hypothetical protein